VLTAEKKLRFIPARILVRMGRVAPISVIGTATKARIAAKEAVWLAPAVARPSACSSTRLSAPNKPIASSVTKYRRARFRTRSVSNPPR